MQIIKPKRLQKGDTVAIDAEKRSFSGKEI